MQKGNKTTEKNPLYLQTISLILWTQMQFLKLVNSFTNQFWLDVHLRFGYKTTHLQVHFDKIAAYSETRNSTHDCVLWAEGGDFFILNLMISVVNLSACFY